MEQSQSPTCLHSPPCPRADDSGWGAAKVVAPHPEQGWSLLCNGVLLFEDTGQLLPDGSSVAPHRPTDITRVAA
ncbi:DUF5999 family protein [Streptomyces sp. PCS3-D2]|uniref:DUF5999 family protein n=1 Tax=Streptomyces sp. PCS3-D2 TaxID=1460244 RepID=UPI000445C5A3|nr:DUF5999 family protein [Streptomyces sp. PCS3-D2]WKV74139.1 DUF5999 family protein [Streptomyces sp. PCS3-D2]